MYVHSETDYYLTKTFFEVIKLIILMFLICDLLNNNRDYLRLLLQMSRL